MKIKTLLPALARVSARVSVLVVVGGLLAAPAMAGSDRRGNGFPKGEHFNLKLLGKADTFKCPSVKIDDETGEPDYGNVIFMPRTIPEGGVTIGFVEGGVPDDDGDLKLGALDRCTEPFVETGETDADGALVTLPPNANGYDVYARLTGKPGAPGAKGENKGKKKGKNQQASASDATLAIDGDLVVLTDPDSGEALALLGTVDDGGVFTPTGGSDTGGTVLVRTDPDVPGKGVVKATDLSGLFQFTGSICKPGATADDPFCAPAPDEPVCEAYCCVSTSPDGGITPPDNVIDSCSRLVDVGVADEDLPEAPLACPVNDESNIYTPTQCKRYEDAWVFDIQALAQYLWTVSGGAYNAQIRFYPR